MSSEVIESEKQKTIALAAFEVFAEHGFRKTSMQLIADRVGMSRPALYLHFQSKEDVFTFISISFFKRIAAAVDGILAKSGHPAQVLHDIFEAFDPDGVMEGLCDAAHGDELMAAKSNLPKSADDIVTGIRLALTEWLRREAELGHIECSDPEVMGQTIMFSFYGLKSPMPSYADYKARSAQLAKVLGNGLVTVKSSNVRKTKADWQVESVRLDR